MCYINGLKVSGTTYIEFKKKQRALQHLQSLKNGFEFSNWLIIKPTENWQDWNFEMAHWEFIPSWLQTWEDVSKSRKRFVTLNATAERLFDSKMFNESARSKRCLVVSSGFIEYRHFATNGSKQSNTYPYYITTKPQGQLFFMAGIYNYWIDKTTGEVITTFAIVTTKANDFMAQIHNVKMRMPTILPQSLAEEWISEIAENRITELAAHQYDGNNLQAWTISKQFKVLENPFVKFEYENLPALEY
jgi:putative SOS response-associated peptidase YedK